MKRLRLIRRVRIPKCTGCMRHAVKLGCPVHDPKLRGGT